MLTGDVLNSEATLNDFDVIGSLEFIAGDAFTLVIRIKQPQRSDKLRYVAPDTATLSTFLPKKDGTVLTLPMTAFTLDRSIWSGDVSSTDSEDLAGGNITFVLDVLGDGTKLIHGVIQNALSIVITGAC